MIAVTRTTESNQVSNKINNEDSRHIDECLNYANKTKIKNRSRN